MKVLLSILELLDAYGEDRQTDMEKLKRTCSRFQRESAPTAFYSNGLLVSYHIQKVGQDSVVRAGWPGNRIPVAAAPSLHIQTGPAVHPASYALGTVSFLGKVPGEWSWPPTLNSAEIKERVLLYLFLPSGLPWPVVGWTLALPYSEGTAIIPVSSII